MKRNIIGLLISIFLLIACGQAPSATPTALIPVVEQATSTPSPTPTQTSLPSATPTASITPLPTIPTFTPTFDVSTIVTVTPAPQAECPKEDPSIVAKFATPNSDGSYEIYSASDILDYLNSGGTATQLRDSGIAEIIDLTGDGVNEVVYRGLIRVSYAILGCKDGKYQNFLDFWGDFGVELADVLDLNKNGNPEIILYNISHYGFALISIFESDGNKFYSLINMGTYASTDVVIDWVSATSPYKITDTNGDGLMEIVIVYDVNQLCGGFGSFCDGAPARAQTTILGWNGQYYVIKQRYNAPARYRFQAIQDGDQQTRYGNYKEALTFYQAAIFDKRLEWWSTERRDYEARVFYDSYELVTSPPLPYPEEDPTEYPRLAAYAYYRILLLHLVQGQDSDASETYTTLEQTFGDDPHARPYLEMATAFWETYQSTQRMYDACAAAIQYAAEHPDILTPLGSDYHGAQSHIYVPEDVCPFR